MAVVVVVVGWRGQAGVTPGGVGNWSLCPPLSFSPRTAPLPSPSEPYTAPAPPPLPTPRPSHLQAGTQGGHSQLSIDLLTQRQLFCCALVLLRKGLAGISQVVVRWGEGGGGIEVEGRAAGVAIINTASVMAREARIVKRQRI
ncbi:hypothetical protein E2C01_036015 [Portunus trituberculatus]|uniref:Uncharacterized protein n=1 Tax=Portunus trituberculatus TaxID=210409 RepID=A0A5B7FD14_PORTR|nr:hypothetical protein [Portunus trituberculatus]